MPFITNDMIIQDGIPFFLQTRGIQINWEAIDKKGPSLVITDKSSIDLKDVLPNTTVMLVTSLVQSLLEIHQLLSESISNPSRDDNGNLWQDDDQRYDKTYALRNLESACIGQQ